MGEEEEGKGKRGRKYNKKRSFRNFNISISVPARGGLLLAQERTTDGGTAPLVTRENRWSDTTHKQVRRGLYKCRRGRCSQYLSKRMVEEFVPNSGSAVLPYVEVNPRVERLPQA